ncbi:hypothetical protein ONA23_04300 [Mycoplasmopsis cynos]|uniref:hypothetical protein n=1 Tax=Mycoplasmopsis cynos TaxID=171284 RepID=UPI0024C9658F|nr:hypothetical protein [Mycoplasmopsis cynos]WAM06224.1 hypothetical protein ONA23_04300 [Mycoplasmopsis cynos]
MIQEFKKEEKNINDAIKKIKSPITKNTLKKSFEKCKNIPRTSSYFSRSFEST